MNRINSIILKSSAALILINLFQFIVFEVWNGLSLNKYRTDCANLNPVEISRQNLWSKSVLERRSGRDIKYAVQLKVRTWKERYLFPQIRDSEVGLIIDGRISAKSKDISFHKMSALSYLFGRGVGGALYQCTFDGPLRNNEKIIHVRNHNKIWNKTGGQ